MFFWGAGSFFNPTPSGSLSFPSWVAQVQARSLKASSFFTPV
jgi:hypothetical protein